MGLVIVVPPGPGGNIFGNPAGLGLPLNVSVAKGDVRAAGMARRNDAIDVAERFFTNSIKHKAGGLVMGNAIEPGAKCLGDLKGFQSAKGVEPYLLMQVERVVSIRGESGGERRRQRRLPGLQ